MNITEYQKEFVQNHCTTLISEPNSKAFFVKVSVANYSELQLMKTNLLTAIKLIADYSEVNVDSQKSEVTHSIGTLVQLLHNLSLEDECDGLSEIIETNKYS